jgi:glycosyltransferase involved in cell wall biosynthesis
MSPPALTIVVPNYNGSRYLAETLASLLGQRRGDFSLIVLDNGSTDDSVPVARSLRDRRLQVVVADRHVGMADNWTRAAALARTTYVVLAHADDVYEPEYVEVMLPLIESHPRAFMVHCRVQSIDEDGRAYASPQEALKDLSWPTSETYERAPVGEFPVLQRGNYILAPTVMFRAEAVRSVGPFSSRYQFVTDWEYWFRGVLQGYCVAGTRQQLVRYRRHRQSGTHASQVTLRRYDEELDLSLWAARQGHEHGLLPSPRPHLSLVQNTVLSDFAQRLADGDRDGARALRDFALRRVPGFRRSGRHALMVAALLTGRVGAIALRQAQAAYVAHLRRVSTVPSA